MKVSTYSQLGQYRRKFLQYNRLLYASALLGLASPAAYAVNTEFTGNIDNDWANPANWSSGLPSSADLAIVDRSITSATDVTLSAKLSVGYSAIGSLTISDSIFTTGNKDVDLGFKSEASGVSGTINILGSSSFINSAIVQIGKAKAGTGYMVLDGGTITGVKYRLGAGGTGSFGSLHIKSGTVNVSSEFRLGSGWASEGQLTIDDGSFTVKDLIFAYNGEAEGTLVHNGGITKVTKLTLGRNNTSIATIELNGGVLQVDILDKIGNSPNESINIAGGILRLKQGVNRALLDTLIAKNSLDWLPTSAVAGYDPASADETIVNVNGTLYIRNDADGYFSVWSTIVVINNPPVFTNDPINASFTEKDQPYSGTLAGTATDADDDLLTYTIISGPAWLNVADDGSLIGEPSAANVGTNSFTIEVNDGNFGSATTLLNIWVAADFTELTLDDFQAGWGNWLDGGEDAKIARTYAIERRAAREDNRRSIHPHTTSFREQGVGLQGNSGVESSTTLANALDLTDYDQLKIDFTYLPILFKDDDSFLIRYSSDGGENWQTIKTFTNDIDFNNGTREVVAAIFNRSEINFTDNALIRFQADANGNSADVYIDSVSISARATSRHNSPPVFTNDPINAVNATKAWPYEDTIAGSASDVDAEPLTYTKTSG
ncbi:MAG: Ig-like domain-containing protein, partial [Colwellia sp.]|nr:Ig-like domain-containing protein [Colwellia sp.]